MLPQTETRAIVTIIPSEQQTTFIEPFGERELAALDTVMHVQDELHRSLLLQHASPGYVCHINDDHELHEAFYLAHHNIISEVSPGWYGFTTIGIERAKATHDAR